MARERIVVLSGPMQGTTAEVTGTLTIGRSNESGLQISDLQISRRHAMVQQTANGTFLSDLGSGNGTYFGNQRIVQRKLTDGDIFNIGPVELRYEVLGTGEMRHTSDGNVVFSAQKDASVTAAKASSVYQTFFDAASSGVSRTAELQGARARLAALYETTQILSSERDVRKLLGLLVEHLFRLVPAHNGVVILRDPETDTLQTEYVKTGSGQTAVTISTTIVRQAFENREAVITYDAAADDRFEAGMSIIAQNISSAMCAPLEHQDEVLGVLYVDTRGTTSAFTQGDLELLVALARGAAIALRNAQYLAKIEQSYQDTLTVLANAIEMRDHYTVGHTWRVTRFAIEIGRKLGWDADKLRECEQGGILHDVGKIAVNDAILGKAGGLTAEEFAKMKVHPERGARMLQDVRHLVPLIPYALYHHEKWSGGGYPFGLSGDDIPVEGRVVAVADTFDAMTSNRPYRKGLDPAIAIGEIKKQSGTQFDPAVVQAFVQCHEDGSLNKILQNYFERDGRSMACPFCSTYIRIPETVSPDAEMACSVCHRRVVARFMNEAWYGELVPETGPLTPVGAPNRVTQPLS
jgi:HD-GYP domain-containing protein (c-di-GMP phosphodiesterase class II)/pSer/pThr/pTyr-binding forkhead associated (FHA) protein